MCGLVGIVGATDASAIDARLRRGMAAIRHRGPDADGVWVAHDSTVAFGHLRLAIIDLSLGGAQPMASHSGRWTIAFNGEVYNYRSLRGRLEADGVRFRSTSDTEVLIEAFDRWGVEEALRRANGMWAFAAYDAVEGAVWFGRDRFGEKPLYVATASNGKELLFGSELAALRALGGLDEQLDRDAIAQYLAAGCFRGGRSVFRDVRQVPPGTTVRVDVRAPLPRATSLVPRAYWSAIDEAEKAMQTPFAGSLDDAADAVEESLSRSIALRMVSDVPLGAFLSGGIDSSIVVALMAKVSKRPPRTFTIGFDESHHDESGDARLVARHLGVDHTELRVRPADALAVIEQLPRIFGEPFADSSQIPTYLVAKMAREHVTVSLSGDAGDELFGGYNRYFYAAANWDRFRRIPRPLRAGIGAGLTAMPPSGWDRLSGLPGARRLTARIGGTVGDRVHKTAGLLAARDGTDLYNRLTLPWTDSAQVVVGASTNATGIRCDRREPSAGFGIVESMMLRDTTGYLVDDILTKVDRAAMAVSLESRVPMLDPELFSLAWSLPRRFKVESGTGKLVLRHILRRHVPAEVLDRPKRGFAVPLDSWLRGPLRPWAEELLSPSALDGAGVFAPETVRNLWQQHLSGRRNWQHQLWSVLMFQAWLGERAKVTR